MVSRILASISAVSKFLSTPEIAGDTNVKELTLFGYRRQKSNAICAPDDSPIKSAFSRFKCLCNKNRSFSCENLVLDFILDFPYPLWSYTIANL